MEWRKFFLLSSPQRIGCLVLALCTKEKNKNWISFRFFFIYQPNLYDCPCHKGEQQKRSSKAIKTLRCKYKQVQEGRHQNLTQDTTKAWASYPGIPQPVEKKIHFERIERFCFPKHPPPPPSSFILHDAKFKWNRAAVSGMWICLPTVYCK